MATEKSLGTKGADADYNYQTYGGGTNFYGQERPDLISTIGKDGALDPRVAEKLSPEMQAIKDMAVSKDEKTGEFSISEGDSPWASVQREGVASKAKEDIKNLKDQQDGALATQEQFMSMRGGLRGGASDRMERSANQQRMGATAGVAAQAQDLNRGISSKDYTDKVQQAGMVGQSEQQMGANNSNRAQRGVDAQNNLTSQFYQSDMQAYGNKMQSDIMAEYSGGEDGGLSEGIQNALQEVFGEEAGGMISDWGQGYAGNLMDMINPETYTSLSGAVDTTVGVATGGLVGDGGIISSPSKWF